MEPTTETVSSSRKIPIIIGIVILLLLSVVGIAAYFFLTGDRAPQITSDPNRVADLSFQYDEVTASPGEQLTLDIFLKSDVSVTGADITLIYNPDAVAITDIQPTLENFMGTPQEYEIVEDLVNNETGQATYRIRVRETGTPPSVTRQGSGVIASVRLAIHPTFTGETPILIFKDEEVRGATSWVSKASYEGSILDNVGSILINVQ